MDRRTYVGSGDIAAIVGCDPWGNAADVWLEKVEGRSERDDRRSRSAKELGLDFEGPLVRRVASEVWEDLEPSDRTSDSWENALVIQHEAIDPERPHLAVHLDGCFVELGIGIEAKLTGYRSNYGKPLTGQVPRHVAAQVQYQMAVSHCHVTHVGAGFAAWGLDYLRYIVPADERVGASLIEAAEWLWEHVQSGTRPPNVIPQKDAIVRDMARVPNKARALDASVLQPYLRARAERLAWTKREHEAKVAVLYALGDAELGQCVELDREVTFMADTSGRRRLLERALTPGVDLEEDDTPQIAPTWDEIEAFEAFEDAR